MTAVNGHTNLIFLCDNCNTVADTVSLVSVASEMLELKSAVGNLASTVSAQTTQLPPSALFQDMVTSLREVNKSLKSLNEDRDASAEQDAEARVILNDITATLKKVDAQKLQNDSSELVSLMKDVREALLNENRGAFEVNPNLNPTQISMPFNFGEVRKRRFGQSNGIGTPTKRTKRQSVVVCNGQQDEQLATVAPLQQAIETGKSLVASRFAPTTSSTNVLSYVKRKLSLAENSDEVSVRSLFPRGRQLYELTFVSFKITASDEIYDKLMEPTFWPNNTIIREFEIREKPQTAVFP